MLACVWFKGKWFGMGRTHFLECLVPGLVGWAHPAQGIFYRRNRFDPNGCRHFSVDERKHRDYSGFLHRCRGRAPTPSHGGVTQPPAPCHGAGRDPAAGHGGAGASFGPSHGMGRAPTMAARRGAAPLRHTSPINEGGRTIEVVTTWAPRQQLGHMMTSN